ncbi:HEAT repeat domain-containing protein [Streptomyces sp. NPDC001617]
MTEREPVARTADEVPGVRAGAERAVAVGGSAGAVISGDRNTTVIHIGPDHRAPAPPSEQDITAAVAHYARQVQRAYGRLDLEVLTPLSEEHPTVELREVFVTPTVRADPPPVELPREILRRLEESGQLQDRDAMLPGVDDRAVARIRDSYLRQPAQDVLEVLASPANRLLVLLGDPGAGKSTLVRYLTLALTHGAVDGTLAALSGTVPFVVELRQYAEESWRHRPFEDFLAHLHDDLTLSVPRAVMEQLLLFERALVVFDGLDELFDAKVRDEVAQRIAAFAMRWPTARVVVTSRVIGYRRHPFDGAGFAHFMLQELDEERIGEFITSWYRASCPGEPLLAERLTERIGSAVRGSHPLREMAGNPLLLTVLAIVGRRQQLPNKRHRLYEHAVTVLISEWDRTAKHLQTSVTPEVSEVLDLLGPDERLEVLRLLARTMQEGHSGIAGNHILRKDLIGVLRSYLHPQYSPSPGHAEAAAKAMVAQLRERNFILCHYGDGVYGFVHRVFLEYLAAADIAYRYKDDREWTPEELVEQVIVPRARDASWHEVLLLLTGQVGTPTADAAIGRLLELHRRSQERDASLVVLALRALAEAGRRPGDLSARGAAAVDAATRSLDARGRKGPLLLEEALPALASFGPHWVGHQRYLRWYGLSGQFSLSDEPSGVVGTLRLRLEELAALARGSYYGVDRMYFAFLWGQQHPHDNAVHDLVLHAVSHDPLANVRSTAMEVLVELWPDRQDVRACLVARSTDDPDADTRRAALRLLAAVCLDDADVRALIERAATEESFEGGRVTLLQALSEGTSERDDVRRFVMRRAIDDDHPYVRQAALRILGDRCSDRPDILDFMVQRVIDDAHPQDCSSAMWVLGEHWPGDPRVRDLLLRQACDAHRVSTRVHAATVLGRHWPHDEDVRRALVRAAGEPHPTLRKAALERLGEHWPHEEETHETVLRLAAEDPDADVRRAAIRLLDHESLRADGSCTVLMAIAEEADARVREDALRQLACHWPDSADVRDLLLGTVTADLPAYTRATVLQALQTTWGVRDDVRELVLRAADDPEEYDRGVFLGVLGDDWPDREDVLEVLLRVAQCPETIHGGRRAGMRLLTRRWFDRDDVRAVVTQATADPEATYSASGILYELAEHWFWRDDVRDIFIHAASHHEGAITREHAVKTLALRHADHPGVQALFRRLATHDPAPDVRFTALTRWALQAEDSEVRPLALARAAADPDAQVRCKLLHMLALTWPAHPDTTAVLQDRAHHDPDKETRAAAAYLLDQLAL